MKTWIRQMRMHINSMTAFEEELALMSFIVFGTLAIIGIMIYYF